MITFQVTLAGKWGGLRTVTVEARSPESAKKKARELARPSEHVSGYAVPDKHDRDLLIEAQAKRQQAEEEERHERALKLARHEYNEARTPDVVQGLNMVRHGLGDGTLAARSDNQPSKIAALVAFATYGGSAHVQTQFDRYIAASETLASLSTGGPISEAMARRLDEIERYET